MIRARLALIAAAGCCSLAVPALAQASSVRGEKTVAGVRATLQVYDTAVLAGNGNAACSVMTATAQKQLAKVDGQASCQAAVKLAGKAFKTQPKMAARFRAFAKTAKITLDGATATVPNWNGGGHSTFTYTKGLWYIGT